MFVGTRRSRRSEDRRAWKILDVRGARFGVGGGRPLLATVTALALAGCGGGGGSSSHYSSHANLLSVTFPDPSSVNQTSPDTPPQAAPLLQQIVFTFDGSPDPNTVGSNTLQIRDSSGFPVPGGFVVDGMVVTFTPQLPTQAVTISASGATDTGGTGLQPGANYTIRTGPALFSFIAGVDPQLLSRFADPNDAGGILIGFATGADPANFLYGPPPAAPQMVAVDPADGTTGVSPNLYSDPGHLFPPRRSFEITFAGSVSPDLANVSGDSFHLIDLDDRPAAFPSGLPLGIDVVVTSNDLKQSVVEVTSSGILPFGHLLALEYPSDLHGISQTGALSGATTIAATFTIASAPAGSIQDTLFEDFDTNARQETDPSQVSVGSLAADWNARGSGILQASFAFQGDGLLGRFVPPPPAAGDTHVIALDTTSQPFPLFDGSTPDAPVFTVTGGVFPFTDVDIPAGVVIQPLGNNPLVITATGSFRLAGTIFVAGQDGTPDNAYDSAVTSVPGGAATCGGGRGGEGQPIIFFPPDQVSYANLVSPPYGGQGFGIDPVDGVMKRIGGTGGQCGMIDHPDGKGKYSTNEELDCSALRGSNPGVKVPGGGGGSMYLLGRQPGDASSGYSGNLRNGLGNVLPTGEGTYTVRDISNRSLDCGTPGQWPFFDDGDPQNDFYGSRGQLTRLIGGQGGGSGASNVEAYYCGIWCKRDNDPSNDGCCFDWLGSKGKYGDSVTDARGGGGGGGGGAVLIQALGDLLLDTTALIDAHGGAGMGGEAIGCSNFGGGGAGGAGGMVVLQSGSTVTVSSGAKIDVREGSGDRASQGDVYLSCDQSGAMGDGGHGSPGFIQLQVPAGSVASVVDAVGSFPRRNSAFDPSPWIDPSNTLNPVEFTPISVAISTWYDLGRTIARVPGSTPAFSFGGLDANGFVQTDGSGNVLDPAGTNIVCDYLGELDPVTRNYKPGQEPKSDFIPPNASVKVEFQGANAVVEGSKEIDPVSITPWSPAASVADGMQFLRWRITFDLTAAPGSVLSPDSPRPTIQSISVPADF
jgi:hypothetical protein